MGPVIGFSQLSQRRLASRVGLDQYDNDLSPHFRRRRCRDCDVQQYMNYIGLEEKKKKKKKKSIRDKLFSLSKNLFV
jgi:hypothetical protein